MNINPDSPAFPVPPDFVSANGELCQVRDFGLTIRAYIAAKALQGLAMNQEMLMANKELLEEFGTDGIDKLQANKAMRLADALIAELNKQP